MFIVSGVRGHMELHNRLQNALAVVLTWVSEVKFDFLFTSYDTDLIISTKASPLKSHTAF